MKNCSEKDSLEVYDKYMIIKSKAVIMAINPEREKVIDKLEKMLEFFRHAEIKTEDSLRNINEKLDDIMSALKYIPSEPSFDSLPTEIKANILTYLCDSGAFIAASVSHEWKQILARNLKQVDEISLGKHCSNRYKCEDTMCFMPEEFLKAAVAHNLDVPLAVCHPLRDIETELIVEGLTSVSHLSLKDNCHCKDKFDHVDHFEDLFKELEKKGKIMDSLQLTDMDLDGLNQNQLVNYLLNKVKNLVLDEDGNGEMLDNELFIKTLLQISTDSQLKRLILRDFDYPNTRNYRNLPIDLADAVSKVPSVDLRFLPALQEEETAKRLVKNIQTGNIQMKSFELGEEIDWRGIFSPEELKKTLEKMDKLKLVGNFDAAQVEAAKSIPGIEANIDMISKCSILNHQD